MGKEGNEAGIRASIRGLLRDDRKYLLALIFIFLLGFLLRMAHTAESSYLVNGIDGPYYVSQVNYLLETGDALHKDSPLAFYYLLAWRYLVGDTVKAIKLGMSVITGLMCVPTYFLVKRITQNKTAAIFSAFLSVFNPYLFSMTYNLYKNEIGVFLLLVFFVIFFRFVSTDGLGKKWKELILLMVVFTAIWGTHIMATGMTVLFVLSYMILAVIRERAAAKRTLRLMAVVGVIAGCALVLLAALFPASFYKVGKLAFLTDLFEDESEGPRFAPAGEEETNRFAVFLFRNLDPVKWLGFPAVIGIILILYRMWKGQNLPGEIFILSTYVSWIILVLPWISRQLVWRFALVSFLPISLAAGYGLAAIKKKGPFLVSLPIIILVLGLSFVEAYAVAKRSRTTISEAEYMELLEIRELLPDDYAIVGNVGEAYWYEVVLGKQIVRSHYVEEDVETKMPLVLIVRKRPMRNRRGGPQPPELPPAIQKWGKVVWDGKHLTAYLLPPKPKRSP